MKQYFSILLSLLPWNMHAQQPDTILRLTDKTELVSIGSLTAIYVDEEAQASFEDVIQPEVQKEFKRNSKEVYHHQASWAAVWFKFTVQNLTGEDVWLSAGANVCWYIDFYRPLGEHGEFEKVQTGGLRPVSTREYPVNFYWLKAADRSDTSVRTYYVRITSGLTQEYILQAGTIQSLQNNKTKYDFLTAAFVGLMIVMMLYNLFLAIATSEKIYLTYVAYLFSTLIVITYANGYPFSDNPLLLKYFMAWANIFTFFAVLFAVQYLRLYANAPVLNKIIWVLTCGLMGIPLYIVLGMPLTLTTSLYQFLLLPLNIVLLYSGIYIWIKGFKNARFYVLGWSFEILSVVIFILTLDGFISLNIVTRNVIYFGTSIEVLMFSLALADRLNILRKEKEKVQLEKLELVSKQNEVLEQKVIERTAEIHHRVKNNLQIISSLINLKSVQTYDDESREVLNQLNGRIFSMGLLHEKLYKNENLRSIRLDLYLKELIDYLLISFQNNENPVKVYPNFEPLEVTADDALTCGLIYNELFTNSMKHAFTPAHKKRCIFVSLTCINGSVIFAVSDNGDSEKPLLERIEKSFGLRFVDQLVSTKLEGESSYQTGNGFQVTITFEVVESLKSTLE